MGRRVAHNKLTKEIVNERLEGRGLSLVGDYINTKTKTTFECDEGHQWEAEPNNILNHGSGCPHCSGMFPLTKEAVNERLKDRPLELVGELHGVKRKASFRCWEGHQWYARPDDVLNGGKGCPICASYGFDPEAPAELYTAQVLTEDGDTVYMIGITNRSFEKRYTIAERGNMRLLRRVKYDLGADAQAEEKRLKEAFSDLLIDPETKTLLKHKGSQTRTTEIFTEDITK